MATSGSKSISVTSWDTLKFSWEIKSQSVANNTSTISWKMELIAGSSGRISSTAAKSWSVTVNGTKYSGSNTVGIENNATKTLASGTTTIAHNADGTKSFSFSFSQQFSITFSGATIGTKSGSGSGTLTTIPRKSSLTVSNGTLGTAQTLTVTKQASSFTHTITYKCGTASGTIAEKSSSTSISWTPPLTLAQQNKTGTTVSITFTITTYNGSTAVGSSTKTISCAIPASVKPSVSIAVSDDMGFAATYGGYIKGRSKIKVVVTAAGAQGSTIKAYKTTANGKSYTAAEVVTDVVASTGTLTISTTVTDSRGRTATASKTITALAYSVPKVTALTAKRTTADGTSSTSGGHLTVTFTASIYALSNKNTAAYILRYKKSADAVYTSVTLSAYAGQYAVTDGKYTFAADGGSTYDIILAAADAFGEADRATVGASESPFFSVLAGWLGIAFGKTAEHEGVFDIGFQTLFSGGVKGIPLADGADLDTILIPNTYIGRSPAAAGYLNCPITTGTTFTLEVLEAGHDGQIMQRLTACSNANLVVYHRFWYSGAWGTEWITQEGSGSAQSGYTALDYIQSTGTQYIDTDYKPNQNTRVVCEAACEVSDVANPVFGARESSSKNMFAFMGSRYGYYSTSYGTKSQAFDESLNTGAFITVDKNRNVTTINGENSLTTASETFSVPVNMTIFANNTNGSLAYGSIKLKSLQIYEDDVLIRNYQPVKNKSGEVGLLDKVEGKFYPNAGSGEFITPENAGSVDSAYTTLSYIQTSGTQYIDLGVKANQDTRVVFNGNVDSAESAWVYGAWNSSGSGQFAAIMGARYELMYGAATKSISGALGSLSIDQNKNSYNVNGTTGSMTYSNFNGLYNMYLFAINAGGAVSSGKFIGKMYSCKVYENGTLIRNMVPVRDSAGVIGLYDTVNRKFYTNAGTGSFTGAV